MIGQIILVAWAAVAAGFDACSRRLPNWLTLGGLLGGAFYALLTGASPLGVDPSNALFAAAAGFFVMFPAYLAGWMGAGDVKLFAAMGMLGGGKVLFSTWLIGSIFTGIVALALIVIRKGSVLPGSTGKRPLPYGLGLSAGFVISLLDILPDWKG